NSKRKYIRNKTLTQVAEDKFRCSFISGAEPNVVGTSFTALLTRMGDSCPPGKEFNPENGECVAPEPQCPGDSVRQPDGSCALECEAPQVPNHVTMRCEAPPLCPEGQYWDFETESCK